MPNLPPRSWIDWTLPPDETGSATSGTDEYEKYLHWLADYLYETNLPVPERQREMVEANRHPGGERSVAFDIASSLGYGLLSLDVIEREIEGGISWDEFHEYEEEYWQGLSPEKQELSPREEVVMCREEFERLCEEVAERKAVPDHTEHADVPFRAVFAALFKDIEDHEERYQILAGFYREFNDCAST
jgi:hypothetical protein